MDKKERIKRGEDYRKVANYKLSYSSFWLTVSAVFAAGVMVGGWFW